MSDPTRDDPWVARARAFIGEQADPRSRLAGDVTANAPVLARFARTEVARALREAADDVSQFYLFGERMREVRKYLADRAHAVEEGHES